VGVVAGVKELRNYLNEKAKVQEILSDLVEMLPPTTPSPPITDLS